MLGTYEPAYYFALQVSIKFKIMEGVMLFRKQGREITKELGVDNFNQDLQHAEKSSMNCMIAI